MFLNLEDDFGIGLYSISKFNYLKILCHFHHHFELDYSFVYTSCVKS